MVNDLPPTPDVYVLFGPPDWPSNEYPAGAENNYTTGYVAPAMYTGRSSGNQMLLVLWASPPTPYRAENPRERVQATYHHKWAQWVHIDNIRTEAEILAMQEGSD